jgi:hypothetical protein
VPILQVERRELGDPNSQISGDEVVGDSHGIHKRKIVRNLPRPREISRIREH